MTNWSVIELTGSRENVAAEIKSNAEMPEAWKAALLSEIAGFMPEFNGVRIDAHCHVAQNRTPPSAAESLAAAKLKKIAPDRITGGIFSVHVSIKPIRLSSVPASAAMPQ